MKVQNHHCRRLHNPPEQVGERLDTLATRRDGLWPHERWPRMRLDKVLGVGAKGGHGPIRYVVEEYVPGRKVVFRFTGPKGFCGTHQFLVGTLEEGCELRHTIAMRISGSALLTWPAVFCPLHNALLEDSLDKVEAELSGSEWRRREWPLHVRVLRKLLARRSGRAS
ncbi:MAG: SRPBCC family protein [Gemmatimonadota bacterium]